MSGGHGEWEMQNSGVGSHAGTFLGEDNEERGSEANAYGKND